jgi:hypothetical protein
MNAHGRARTHMNRKNCGYLARINGPLIRVTPVAGNDETARSARALAAFLFEVDDGRRRPHTRRRYPLWRRIDLDIGARLLGLTKRV